MFSFISYSGCELASEVAGKAIGMRFTLQCPWIGKRGAGSLRGNPSLTGATPEEKPAALPRHDERLDFYVKL